MHRCVSRQDRESPNNHLSGKICEIPTCLYVPHQRFWRVEPFDNEAFGCSCVGDIPFTRLTDERDRRIRYGTMLVSGSLFMKEAGGMPGGWRPAEVFMDDNGY